MQATTTKKTIEFSDEKQFYFCECFLKTDGKCSHTHSNNKLNGEQSKKKKIQRELIKKTEIKF